MAVGRVPSAAVDGLVARVLTAADGHGDVIAAACAEDAALAERIAATIPSARRFEFARWSASRGDHASVGLTCTFGRGAIHACLEREQDRPSAASPGNDWPALGRVVAIQRPIRAPRGGTHVEDPREVDPRSHFHGVDMLPVSKRLYPTSRENGSRGSATSLSPFLRTKVLAVLVLSAGCAAGSTADFGFEDSMFDDAGTVDSAFDDGKESSFEGMYEQWKASVLVDPALQIYAVGDRITPTSLVGEEEARRYFEATVAAPKLTLHNGQQYPGDPIVGSYFPERAVLRYCVDRVGWNAAQARFAYLGPEVSLFDRVADAFGEAASVWQTISGVRFVRDVGRDGSCSPAPGDNITWYVTPYTPDPSEPLEYFAFVLRPHHNALGPNYREFLVYDEMVAEFTFVDAQPFINWFTLEGILLHTMTFPARG
jgi:hypothetical protein